MSYLKEHRCVQNVNRIFKTLILCLRPLNAKKSFKIKQKQVLFRDIKH